MGVAALSRAIHDPSTDLAHSRPQQMTRRFLVFSAFDPGVILYVAVAVAVAAIAVSTWLLRDSLRGEKILRESEARIEVLSDQLFAATETLQQQRQLLESQSDLVVSRDLSGQVRMVNTAYSEAAGKSPSDLLGSNFDFTGGKHILEGRDGGAERYDQSVTIRGIERWIAWSVLPVRNREGQLVERYAVGRDITERRRAEAASEAKSRFLATVSHEVRTPLNGVLGMADLLMDTKLEPEQGTYVRAIKTSGEALLSLIDEILDFSKIEAGKSELASEPFDLLQITEGVIELLAPRAQGKDIEIALSIDPTTPRMVVGDAARLRQVLLNLAGNAVKFTDTGGVGVALTTDNNEVIFEVIDTGPGIPADRLEAIFAEFEQVDGSGGRQNEGTGLGLAISRRLVEHMGGKLAVTSEPSVGSTFTLRLPVRVATGGAADAPPDIDLEGKRILVVANGPFEGRFLVARLEERGATVHLARQTHAALAELACQRFNTMIIDCGLGPEESRSLAAVARTAGVAQRLVMLSPYERRSFGSPHEAGFDGYLVKPVRPRSLYARLGEGAALVTSEATTQPAMPQTGQRSYSVLLAEDNDINALLATKLLEKHGCTVTWVKDGTAALKAAAAAISGKGPTFDAAMLDVRMPGMDGKTVVQSLRPLEAQARTRPMLIAAVTANAFPEDKTACLAAGFDLFLAKPLARPAVEIFIEAIMARSAAGPARPDIAA
jgi:PAS domain S-box-containing protein